LTDPTQTDWPATDNAPSASRPKDRLVFGCGFLGLPVARRWRAEGLRVFVVTRSDSSACGYRLQGFQPIVGDVTAPATLPRLPQCDTVLYAIGYDRHAGPSRRTVYVDGLAAALRALPEQTRRIIYVSSTGVYGQADGSTVDEQSPCQPNREGGRVCLEAEQLLAAHRLGPRAVILRMAGLYGPGRIPRLADVAAGKPLDAQPEAMLNLIHVDDAARAVAAAETCAVPRVYNVSDGTPVTRRAFYEHLARLIDAPPPVFAPTAGDKPTRGRGGNKRVSNARLVAELGVEPQFPSYREGLAAIVG
jgi:nucleoside-diphosphate-sugar epimerase